MDEATTSNVTVSGKVHEHRKLTGTYDYEKTFGSRVEFCEWLEERAAEGSVTTIEKWLEQDTTRKNNETPRGEYPQVELHGSWRAGSSVNPFYPFEKRFNSRCEAAKWIAGELKNLEVLYIHKFFDME